MKRVIIGLLIIFGVLLSDDFITLEPYSTFDSGMIDESSGISKSRNFENIYWTLNDSGDEARIFAVDRKGTLCIPSWMESREKYKGLEISDAVNIDWEDITTDNEGNIYIAACGNNGNTRRDLAIYVVKEPNPKNVTATRISRQINFYYPEQKEFPPINNNFDCEAIYYREGNIYLLTKHRADLNTVLYRIDLSDKRDLIPAKKLAEFNIEGNVTAADCSSDGSRVAVLTYNNVWVFDTDGENIFKGKKRFLRISGKQCEGITFDTNERLIITNEQKDLYELDIDRMNTR
ncbi:MAG: hypothetical protein CR982_08295 [Candidatus Cloacimonadota bacterium]|nr:MAG: hypothetical protein CR982_08295 [Candidatus Cloacimonadota bacterium]PIE79052.1 MAG: hypothetical protein CSA15_04740 [Candidatus Delongbacteria bacterium]